MTKRIFAKKLRRALRNLKNLNNLLRSCSIGRQLNLQEYGALADRIFFLREGKKIVGASLIQYAEIVKSAAIFLVMREEYFNKDNIIKLLKPAKEKIEEEGRAQEIEISVHV